MVTLTTLPGQQGYAMYFDGSLASTLNASTGGPSAALWKARADLGPVCSFCPIVVQTSAEIRTIAREKKLLYSQRCKCGR